MRVLIDTSFAARGPSGTGVYVERLVGALRESGIDVVTATQRFRLRPGRAGGALAPARSATNALLDAAWLAVGLPRAARRARAELVHHPLPARSPALRRPQVVTVHDVTYERRPQGFGRVWLALARRRHRRAVSLAAAVVCVSEASARDARELLGADPDRIVVAHHGPGQELPVLPRVAPAHFLYVGDDEERKDVGALIEAHARYRSGSQAPLPLVLAGASARRAGAPGGTGESQTDAHRPAKPPALIGEPQPDGRRLAELLAAAVALVHPSREEGFGLTLLEAMAAGTPVVAVRNPGAEEVCGDAALLVESGGLAEAMLRLEADGELQARIAAAGHERARAFSWKESALQHQRAYTLSLG